MNIVILAAGMGKRMQSALPKVLHKLAGKSLLAHVIERAQKLKPSKIYIVCGYKDTIVRDAFSAMPNLFFITQNPQLGTGDAVIQTLPYLKKNTPTLILYGDVPLVKTNTLQKLIKQAYDNKLAILTMTLEDPSNYGRVIRKDNKIIRIIEQKDANKNERSIQEISSGIIAVPTSNLYTWLKTISSNNLQHEYYLTDIITQAVADQFEIISIQPSHIIEVLGVNDKIQLARLERLYQRYIATILMEQGVTIVDPNRLDIRGNLQCGKDITIDVNCIFEGEIKINDGAIIGANCIIRHTNIGKNANILPFSHIDGTNIGAFSQIGPYARLRPGTTLGKHVQIGNFVEVKNSQISNFSQAKHLTYIGDATIGVHVNIGAGVITCNYNNIEKFHTIINDYAFIGSDTQLIAPICVGKNAIVGAGTTLTKDAPENQLTLSRVKQLSLPSRKQSLKKK